MPSGSLNEIDAFLVKSQLIYFGHGNSELQDNSNEWIKSLALIKAGEQHKWNLWEKMAQEKFGAFIPKY